MGYEFNLTIFVRVVLHDGAIEWRTVKANSISDGMQLAESMHDVERVLEGSIIPGGVAT